MNPALGTKTAVITGATGFVGSHLARHLVSSGWNVHAIVRPVSKSLSLLQMSDRITIHRHYGSTLDMIDIMKEIKPDLVFHLASLFLAQHQARDVTPMIQSNLTFATQLLEAMNASGVCRLVNTGTSWQHYENKQYSPVCLYAATKQAFESILAYYTEATPLQAVTLKLFDTYGPDDTRPKLFTLLQKAAREQIPLPMSAGEQLLDLVYIDDVVNAFCLAAEHLLEGKNASKSESFAVSSGNPVTLKHIVSTYEKAIGREVNIQWGARPYRPREVMVPWNQGDIVPDWRPLIDLETGIKKIVPH
ncbi:NAD-dependent epimerase/dehydratase family protein [Brevibacillus sp. NRS-1366]|uniref:NAD-dependent epimerase/dehydratase family protein n=1 Tax=Brevibacillus sp. NRS-1366 TaxID=3233899 RepID=UPI003D22CFE5